MGCQGETYLFEGINARRRGMILVHEGDGAFQEAAVSRMQANDPRVCLAHRRVQQAAAFKCRQECRAVTAVDESRAYGVAQQMTWLNALEQLCRRLVKDVYKRQAYARDRARFLRNWSADSALHQLLDQRLPQVPGTCPN